MENSSKPQKGHHIFWCLVQCNSEDVSLGVSFRNSSFIMSKLCLLTTKHWFVPIAPIYHWPPRLCDHIVRQHGSCVEQWFHWERPLCPLFWYSCFQCFRRAKVSFHPFTVSPFKFGYSGLDHKPNHLCFLWRERNWLWWELCHGKSPLQLYQDKLTTTLGNTKPKLAKTSLISLEQKQWRLGQVVQCCKVSEDHHHQDAKLYWDRYQTRNDNMLWYARLLIFLELNNELIINRPLWRDSGAAFRYFNSQRRSSSKWA